MSSHTCILGGPHQERCAACLAMYEATRPTITATNYRWWATPDGAASLESIYEERDRLMGKVTIGGLKYECRSTLMGTTTLTMWHCERCEVLHVDRTRAEEHVCLPRAWLDNLSLGAFESDGIVRPNRNASIAEQYEALSIMFAKLADREMRK